MGLGRVPTISEGQNKIEEGSSPTEAEPSASPIHLREAIEAVVLYVGLPAVTLYPLGTAIYLSQLFIFYGKNPIINTDFNSVAYAVILLPAEYVMLQAFDVLTRGGFPFLAVLVPAILLSFLFYVHREDWRKFWDISKRRHHMLRLLIAVVVVSLIVGYAYTIWTSGRLGSGGRFAAILTPLLLVSLPLTLFLSIQRSYKQSDRQEPSILRSLMLVTTMVILVGILILLIVIFVYAVVLVLSPQGKGDTGVGLGLIAVYAVFLGGVLSGAKMGKDYAHSKRLYALKGTFIPLRRWILKGLIIAYLVYSTTNAILAGAVGPPALPIAEIDANNDMVPLLGTNSPYLLQNNTTYWFLLNNDGDVVALTNEQVGNVTLKW